jgi:MFS transporter, FHS family, L-fucose permease
VLSHNLTEFTAMLYITLFFESICFPTIVALGIRGLGRHYKRGSGFIVGGVIGGGCIPALTGKVADLHNNTGISMVVPLAFMLSALSYPICVNFVEAYRTPADALGKSEIGTSGRDIEDVEVPKISEGAQAMEIEKHG